MRCHERTGDEVLKAGLRSRWLPVIGAMFVLSGGLLSSAQAHPHNAQAHRDSTASPARPGQPAGGPLRAPGGPDYGIPPLPAPDPYAPYDPYDGKVQTTTAETTKAKISVSLSNFVLLGYLKTCVSLPDVFGPGLPLQTCCPDPSDLSTCAKDNQVQAPATSLDDTLGVDWSNSTGSVWVESPSGTKRRYGTFPPVRVHLLAFGSVPVTATVHISQPTGRDGLASPLTVFDTEEFSPLNGATVDGWGRVPDNGVQRFALPITVSGDVDIRISDVAVDQVPLQVGPNCHTATPARLAMRNPGGSYESSDATPIATLAGRAGGFRPLDRPTGVGLGNLSIPAFAGCHDGAEDLDPLFTGMVSGPTNPIELYLAEPLFECGNPESTLPCPAYPSDAPAASPARAAASRRPSWSLTTAQSTRLARALTHISPSLRTSVISTLPSQVVAALPHGSR
jgi:hypothetical protein